MEMNARVQEHVEQLASLNAAKARAEETTAARDEEIARLAAELESLQSSETETEALRTNASALARDKESLETRLAEATSAIDASKREADALGEANRTLENKILEKDEQVVLLDKKLKEAQEASDEGAASLREQLESAQRDAAERVATLEEQLAEATTRLQATPVSRIDVEAAESKSAIEDALAVKDEEIALLRARDDETRGAAESELRELQAKLDALEQEKHANENQLKRNHRQLARQC